MKQGPLGIRLRIRYKQLIQTPLPKDGLHINAGQAWECGAGNELREIIYADLVDVL